MVISMALVGLVFLLLPLRITSKPHDLFIHTFGGLLKIGSEAKITDLPGKLVSEETVSIELYNSLLEERSQLEDQFKEIYRRYIQLNEEFEQATGARQRLPDVGPGHIWAEVITFVPEKNEIDINRGEQDGIRKGLYVIGQDYLIGTVEKANNYSAKVQLLTSPEHSLIVEIEAVDDQGKNIYKRAFMKGDGKSGCVISGVETKYKIEQGNYIYAYAKPGYLNSPLIIGKVSEIKNDGLAPMNWQIKVVPSFDISTLERVFAVTMEPVEGGTKK